MGLFDRIKDFVNAEDSDLDEDWDDDDDEPNYKPPRRSSHASPPSPEPYQRREPIRAPLSQERTRDRERENVIPLRGQEAIRRITAEFQIVMTEPKSFDECPELVDSLKSRKPVILNLECMENDPARKIFDFLSGATYALNGNVQKIAQNIFVFLPENVDIQASQSSQSYKYGQEKGNNWN